MKKRQNKQKTICPIKNSLHEKNSVLQKEGVVKTIVFRKVHYLSLQVINHITHSAIFW